jgi:uncharacterized RDD family membrane protein YckC
VSDPAPVGYAGFVSRGVALGVDALAINLIAVVTGALINLIDSLLGGGGHLGTAAALLAGVAWFLWSGTYFVSFWTLTGQTPGARLLGFRVVRSTGGSVGIPAAIRRFLGMLLALIPFGAGFLPVLVDDRRRGLHDRIAGTVVRWDERQTAELAPLPSIPLAPGPAPGPAPAGPELPARDSGGPAQPVRVIGGSS